MKVEIWSDVMCPFCYIGKRKFEAGLNQFAHKEGIEIEWKSFQLDPEMKSGTGQTINEYLSDRKGWSIDKTKGLHKTMTETAKQAELDYQFDKAIPANSFNAHRLSHLAARHQLQDQVEEKLFAAYFTEGKNIDNTETLVGLGVDAGLSEKEIRDMLSSNQFADEVRLDIDEANQIGVNGVPFFVFDRKYAVSGAQGSDVFLSALEKSWTEFSNTSLKVVSQKADGETCSTEGNC